MSLTIGRLGRHNEDIIILYNSVNDDVIRIYDVKGIKDYILKHYGKETTIENKFCSDEIEEFYSEYDLEEVF